MNQLRAIGLFALGVVFVAFDVILRLFTIVAAIFAMYVMVGLIVEWTTALFKGRKPNFFPRERSMS